MELLIAEDLLLLLLDDEKGTTPSGTPVPTVHEDIVRGGLTAALVSGQEPDDRTAALISLLHAIGRVHQQIDHDGVTAATTVVVSS